MSKPDKKPVIIAEIDRFEINRMGTVRIYRYHRASPGRVSGPPELCYPPEPSEIEADILLEDGTVLELDEDELEEVKDEYEAMIEEEAAENEHDDI